MRAFYALTKPRVMSLIVCTAVRMSGWLYLAAALALGAVYLGYAVRLYSAYSDRLAQRCFRYSIVYLAALFAALLVDHYLA